MESDFLPVMWPEAQAPPEVLNCEKCELHRHRSRVIWGEGNPEAPVIVVLDNPGAREDEGGNPFICGVRQTLQKAAFEAGFRMDDLFVTFILKCRPKRRYDKEAARSACMGYLTGQINLQKPELAFCLGNVAVQWFFSDMEAEVKSLRGSWHEVGGLPTAVSYHPLAVRRRPALYNVFAQDWAMLARRYKSLKG